jgi:hypothetical protein
VIEGRGKVNIIFNGWAACARRAFVLLAVAALTGCANFYVDGATKEIDAAQFKRRDPVHPVQVLFEFQTKGVTNANATTLLKARVLEQIKSSGLFSEVGETPVAGGALLGITLNNVPLSDDAFSKGFVTGLTFGLAGSTVSDGYICTARYSAAAGGVPIVRQARHAIHTAMGATSAPGNATKAASIDAAVTTMTRQIVSNVLNDLTLDPTFK